MIDKPYYHFYSLYKNSNDTLVCVDDHLRTIYVSNSFMSNYDLDIDSDALLNCFVPSKYFVAIQNGIDDQQSFSFDFVSIVDNCPKKCFVLPAELYDQKYATLLFIDIDKDSYGNVKNNELKNLIIEADQKVRNYTSAIIANARNRNRRLYEELESNKTLINTLKIRHELENLAMISSSRISYEELYLIDINKYVIRTKQLVDSLLGENKIRFSFDLCNEFIVTELCYDVFDMLLANSISVAIKNKKRNPELLVRTRSRPSGCLIILSDSVTDADAIEYLLSNGEQGTPNINGIAVIKKIVNSYKGNLIAKSNKSGGYSLGFSLPPMPERIECYRQPKQDLALKQGLTSVFCSGIADLLDD